MENLTINQPNPLNVLLPEFGVEGDIINEKPYDLNSMRAADLLSLARSYNLAINAKRRGSYIDAIENFSKERSAWLSKRQISRRTHKGPRRTAAKDADRAKKQKLSTIRREKILLAQSVAMTTGRGPKENRIVPEHDRLMNFVDNIKSIIALEESGVELSPLRSNAMVSWQPPRSIDSALAHKDVTTSVMEQNSANNDGLRVAIRKVILIHLAKGPMSITLDDRIPPLPTGFFQRDIDLLNTMWDDHDPQWKGSSPLVLSGDLDGVPATLPIALIYWQEIYKNYGSGRWASSGQSWRNYESLIKEYRLLGQGPFWQKYSDHNGSRFTIRSILDTQQAERSSAQKLLVARARDEFDDNGFNALFSYRSGSGHALFKPHVIADRYLKIKANTSQSVSATAHSYEGMPDVWQS